MFSLLLLVFVAALASANAQAQPMATPRFVDVPGAWTLLGKQAVVLDARPAAAYRKGHLASARNTAWDAFSDTSSPLAKGKLNPDLALLGRLVGALGVRHDRPVLVYGDPLAGWGEEGRIAWMLETLGHRGVHVLDGGVNAWTVAGGTLTRDVPPPAAESFQPRFTNAASATADEVRAAISRPGTVILDTRTSEEFLGATWYGAPRGGHVPGAKLLTWSKLLDGSGKLLPAARLREVLATAGATPNLPVIAYCTGGVRSGFVYWALTHAGFTSVKNFPGSWWEWSGRPELPVETK